MGIPKIIYITNDIKEFSRFVEIVHNTKLVDVLLHQPKRNLKEGVAELFSLSGSASCFIASFDLNKSKTDTESFVHYKGAQLLEGFIESKERFPCFILTDDERKAFEYVYDVNYVYHNSVLEDNFKFGREVIAQISLFSRRINKHKFRYGALLLKSNGTDLTEAEENELLFANTFLKNYIPDYKGLSQEEINEIVSGNIVELTNSSNALIEALNNS